MTTFEAFPVVSVRAMKQSVRFPGKLDLTVRKLKLRSWKWKNKPAVKTLLESPHLEAALSKGYGETRSMDGSVTRWADAGHTDHVCYLLVLGARLSPRKCFVNYFTQIESWVRWP